MNPFRLEKHTRTHRSQFCRQRYICRFWNAVCGFSRLALLDGFPDALSGHEEEDGVDDAVGAGQRPGHLVGDAGRLQQFTGHLIQRHTCERNEERRAWLSGPPSRRHKS